jgi:hypothetical protein
VQGLTGNRRRGRRREQKWRERTAGIQICFFIYNGGNLYRGRFPLEVTMSDVESRVLREMKIENMKAEQEYLRVLRNSHLQWMNSADDLEINGMHGDIVDLINQLEARFGILLETLQAQNDKE